MAVSADLHAERFSDHLLKRFGVTERRPEFELRIAARPDLQECVLTAIV
jgi:hypothetical protein